MQTFFINYLMFIINFCKNKGSLEKTILFEKCTAQTLIIYNKSAHYIRFNETILHTKPVIAFLNRNSGKTEDKSRIENHQGQKK